MKGWVDMTCENQAMKQFNVLIAQDISQSYQLIGDIDDRLRRRSDITISWLTHSQHHEPTQLYLSHIEEAEPGVVQYLTEKAHPWTVEAAADSADLLVVAGLGPDSFAKMLHGMTNSLLLEMLRSWDVSKKIILIPAMSIAAWENPMTKKQLNKVRRTWNWIRVLDPVLWDGKQQEAEEKAFTCWPAFEELIQTIQNQADLMTIDHDMDTHATSVTCLPTSHRPMRTVLPPELWSMILETVGDWELATALGVHTNLLMPIEWKRSKFGRETVVDYSGNATRLEWAILTGTNSDIVSRLDFAPPKWLSKLSVKLIIKFSRTDILTYLETLHPDLFWSTFGHTLLPTKASAVFGKTAILEWWRTSPSFLTKEYTVEAIDSASKAGFVHVLDWWLRSGLPLRYTEAALEQASSKGNLKVLDWWLRAVQQPLNDHTPPLRLKVGKSLIFAAQNAHASTLLWWANCGIPTAHEESVVRIASANGHVEILQLWKEAKGEKMQFDNQVLVGATKNGHAEVLEWWKRSGYRVEYKTCDVEEALEDSLGGTGEVKVRAWWARNGLNLGVGTSEWMKVKVL